MSGSNLVANHTYFLAIAFLNRFSEAKLILEEKRPAKLSPTNLKVPKNSEQVFVATDNKLRALNML